MTVKTPETKDRKPRADAQRNRDRILDVAKQEFTRVGANASLEEIAKKAGVAKRAKAGRHPYYRRTAAQIDLCAGRHPAGPETVIEEFGS